MSLEKVQLRKLLRLFYATDARRRSILLSDIYSESMKDAGEDDGGGDFHSAFWADAKRHVDGKVDLHSQTIMRVEKNERRKRLYPLLEAGFLNWWNEKRRWRNEKFVSIQNINGRVVFPELPGLVKVENLLALRVEDQFTRIVYPYFAEAPILPDEGARLGLWIAKQAIPRFPLSDFRILDVLRSKSYGIIDVPLQGNEEQLFKSKYKSVLDDWNKLKEEK